MENDLSVNITSDATCYADDTTLNSASDNLLELKHGMNIYMIWNEVKMCSSEQINLN